jgi:hypothetical protein
MPNGTRLGQGVLAHAGAANGPARSWHHLQQCKESRS